MASPDFPRRVVCLQPSASVILAAVGQLERVAACTRYCADVCPELEQSGIAIVSDSWTANAAEITAAQPDLVIAAVPYQERAVAEILKSGIRFLGLAPRSLADIYGDIAAISGIMGVPEQAEPVIGKMQEEIEAIRGRTRTGHKPRVFCEEWGKPLIASQPWVAELMEAAGGVMIGTPGAQTSVEAVLAEDPEVWIAAWCGAGDRVPLEKVVQQRGWHTMRAVREDRVYCIRDEYLNTPAPTLLCGLRALAAALHPARFPHAPGLKSIAPRGSQLTGAESCP